MPDPHAPPPTPLLDWAEMLGVSLYEIRVAVADVGCEVKRVRERLNAKVPQ
jgi:hypothetical protein